jgi:CRP/FNR family cyclic AMP-dependent transcriptional regulator
MTSSATSNLERSSSGDTHVCNPPTACLACLARSGLSAELTDNEIEDLFKIADVRQLSKGEVLVSQGDDSNLLYSISKGSFAVTLRKTGDQEVELGRLGPGTITGELAFLDGLKRTATVKAATDNCCVISLDRKNLESLLEANPRLVYKVMRAILRSAHKTVGTMDKSYLDLIGYIQG